MLVSLVLFWICILLFVFIRIQRPKNFPPGPRPLPIFRNLFHLITSNPLKAIFWLTQRYGNVYSLYIGGRLAVVLNGLKAVKEALVTNAVDFSGRPENSLTNHLSKGKGVIFADYGPSWKEHRCFALMTLRNFGLGKQSMEKRILGEAEHIVARLEKCSGGSMNAKTLFHDAASNIIYLVLFGTRLDYEDKTHKDFIRCVTENSKISNGPWGMKVGGRSFFDEKQLMRYVVDLQFAGIDTTSNTLLTAFLYLMTQPGIQEDCASLSVIIL
ncbi:cytochrome P450 2J6-like [Electrophorus electricus]|uniref:cytochrome P450 2J6-like n=1 Tax=Electrophorus electricus TaxID=8005 RepID=UPI0015D085FB|nr:cytochrome P450 2J6-like [Electrophorus electricus]